MGCHHITEHDKEFRAALPDGDNPTSIRIVKDNLYTQVFTRKDFKPGDLISLVEYVKGFYFTQAVHWTCKVCGYNYYENDNREVVYKNPYTEALKELEPKSKRKRYRKLTKIDERVLDSYIRLPNEHFCNEGIKKSIQYQFEIGFDLQNDRITIPIRDDLSNLVGIKGRTIYDDDVYKYIYLISTERSLLLYGLYKSLDYIKAKKEVIVFEAEKSVLQAWSMGYKNCVGIGGGELSHDQVVKLEKLDANVILAYDKDTNKKHLKKEAKKFMFSKVSAIWDMRDILDNKNSPVDLGKNVWEKLYKRYCYPVNYKKIR